MENTGHWEHVLERYVLSLDLSLYSALPYHTQEEPCDHLLKLSGTVPQFSQVFCHCDKKPPRLTHYHRVYFQKAASEPEFIGALAKVSLQSTECFIN